MYCTPVIPCVWIRIIHVGLDDVTMLVFSVLHWWGWRWWTIKQWCKRECSPHEWRDMISSGLRVVAHVVLTRELSLFEFMFEASWGCAVCLPSCWWNWWVVKRMSKERVFMPPEICVWELWMLQLVLRCFNWDFVGGTWIIVNLNLFIRCSGCYWIRRCNDVVLVRIAIESEDAKPCAWICKYLWFPLLLLVMYLSRADCFQLSTWCVLCGLEMLWVACGLSLCWCTGLSSSPMLWEWHHV